ncbi:MAG: permease-like cell division protein FtsX [Microscillaceae bacterium]|nr:permease-like cell division protein FtsX [Microscillaceae bacterium]
MKNQYSYTQKFGSLLSINVIVSISLVLFIFGLCGLLILHTNQLGQIIRRNFELQIFLKHNLEQSELDDLRRTLINKPFTQKTKGKPDVSFISKEEAKTEFIQSTGEDFMRFLNDNPLRDSFVLKIKPEFYTNPQIIRIQKELEKIPGVFEVSYVKDLVITINRNIAMISLVLLLFGVFILLTVIILIDNTIKLALFSQRLLIRSMQLVGATDSFIQRPFIIQAMIQGSISGLISSCILFALLKYLHLQLPELILLYRLEDFLALICLLIVLGSLVGGLSAFRAVRKYLRLSLDELY